MTTHSPILVTGANKRGGLAICKALVAQGQPVVAIYRNTPGELTSLANVDMLKADLSQRDSRDALIDSIKTRYTALRGIIHNASLWLDDSLDNLNQMLQVHVEAPYQLNEALTPLLQGVERADIIHVCDDTATQGTKNHIAYAASKAALLNLTLSFAEKLAPKIRVNAISPGLLMLKEGSDAEYQNKTLRKALLEIEPGNTPLVDAVLYLLHSTYNTGNNIVINGGRHLKRHTSK
ncbi:dihydromonapterin reductase [Pseudomonas sp. GOM6]|uniref:dihydromonapterin reductase n=1 Tax=Pseudomonas sp. GOM6 TaxID=3036944 RepID=UPI00240A63BA|nr:dihydromonapterin reductase [Pseudomonas sp. GOM6]MDG1583206.1 dihydromonapterin reductase [Pseudomonas sp. GOM6]